ADVVGHVLHLWHLVVVRQDHRVPLARELADLCAHAGDVARHVAPCVLGGVRFQRDLLYRHVLVTSTLRSSAGAECVSAPTDIRSTPARAAATAPSSVIPPDASNFARPAVISTASRIRSVDMLSSRTTSALLSRASRS